VTSVRSTPHKQFIFYYVFYFNFSICDTFLFVESSHDTFIFFIDDVLIIFNIKKLSRYISIL
jgi:hypothetical protein